MLRPGGWSVHKLGAPLDRGNPYDLDGPLSMICGKGLKNPRNFIGVPNRGNVAQAIPVGTPKGVPIDDTYRWGHS